MRKEIIGYKVLKEKYEGRRLLGRPKCRWDGKGKLSMSLTN
jgi:hypothetical protein